ncbi:DUF4139 domain-containing protein [Ralstonia pseudosolanacearum]|uniref:DUF4139 domain-containing protein n=1 Tax=Ralstonia pseudosolanacearum TaxID=1310165 RepID=UPI001FF97B84|nr:DUF4139 domain-containing protein [Ralstonia pseudosolanacearum]
MARAFMGAAISATVAAAHAATPSRITEVTLYPDSATVVRTATVAPGARSVELTCLPPTFDPQSLRVEGDAAVRVGDIRTESVPSEGAGCARTALEAQIRALEEQRAALDVQLRANALTETYLKGVSERASGDTRAPATDFSTLGKTADALTRSAQEVFARQEQLKRRDSELQAQLNALQQTQRPRAATTDTVQTIRIALSAPRGGEVRVSYQTTRAGWRPAYQASLEPGRSEVIVERQAAVAQATGEDWHAVRMRLSTGQPRTAPRGPEPLPWHLHIQQPVTTPHYERIAPAPMAAPALAVSMVSEPKLGRNNNSAGTDDAPLFQVNTIEGTFATEFDVPGAVDLPSDAQKATFSLTSQTLPATLAARSTPHLDSAAYLVAMIDRPEGIWPAGNMQLRREGTVVGSTFWNPAGEDERLTLPFGRDDLVSVKVATPKSFQRSVGLLDQRNESQIASVYTVRNRHREPVSIEVLEATPTSESEDIKIRATFSPDPTQHDWEKRAGVVAWQRTLKPGESVRLSAEYLISYPKDARVNGLR